MQEPLVNFETAKLAKEKGFPLLNRGYGYSEDGKLIDPMFGAIVCEAPAQSLVQKWLREVHDIHLMVKPWKEGNYQIFVLFDDEEEYNENYVKERCFNSYEKAIEAGLKEGLKTIKN